MIVYTSINTGQYSKRFIGYFKSSLSFLAVQGKMAFCCVFFFNVKSNGKIRHFSIHKDDICSRKKKQCSFILLLPCEINDWKISKY